MSKVQRHHQFVFAVSLPVFSWFGMIAIHELGHVVGAVATGGSVRNVVLHPLRISRTDVSPNPSPLFVVWAGPIVGCLLPVLVSLLVPKRMKLVRKSIFFFAGFCLISNGAYIAFGSFDGVGDCGVMLQHGSPRWLLLTFGAVAIPVGFLVWHQLGAVKRVFSEPSVIAPRSTYILLVLIAIMLVIQLVCFSQ